MPFNGIPNLRDANEPIRLTPAQLCEIKKCAVDPIYFIRNYVYINTKDNGMQLFDMYDFQELAIARFMKYRYNINRWSRQVGKSTIVRGFILWWGIFHKDQLIAMIGNKLSLAKEQLQQLRDSYIRIPMWMQPGVKLWNKTSIQFSNNSRIIVSSSSPDNIRGFAINLLYLDEFAFLRPNLATEFIASVFPSISSGKTTRCIITSTPNGMNHFYRMWEDAVDEKNATPEQKANLYIKSTVLWSDVPGRTKSWADAEKLKIGEQRFRQEYECEFIGSSITLIDYKHLQKMAPEKPMEIPNEMWPPSLRPIINEISMRYYDKPRDENEIEANGFSYVASIDSGYGIRKDYHVLHIVLARSNIKCEQVFTMSSNSIDITEFCKIANMILRIYHFPYLIIEYNGPGKSAYDYMFGVAMYPHLINFDSKARGLWATPTMKNNVVIMLKMYIQRAYIKLKDEKTIMELMSYTQTSKTTWGAGGGNHDDHVTALYWIIYFLQSSFYYGNYEDMETLTEEEQLKLTNDMKERIIDTVKYIQSPEAMAEQHALGQYANS